MKKNDLFFFADIWRRTETEPGKFVSRCIHLPLHYPSAGCQEREVFFSYTYCRANDKMKANREQTRVKLINRKPETTFKVQVLLM